MQEFDIRHLHNGKFTIAVFSPSGYQYTPVFELPLTSFPEIDDIISLDNQEIKPITGGAMESVLSGSFSVSGNIYLKIDNRYEAVMILYKLL